MVQKYPKRKKKIATKSMAIYPMYFRYIVELSISNSLEAKTSIAVMKQAVKDYGKPEMVNSDQGSQFTCEDWINYLDSEGIEINMDGKGRAIDNIFIERFWRSVKHDYVYLHPAGDGLELYQGLKKYMHYYITNCIIRGLTERLRQNAIRQHKKK